MMALLLSMAFAVQKPMYFNEYDLAFVVAKSCPSTFMMVQKVTNKENCIVTSHYVDEECSIYKNKIVCISVKECRIKLKCMGEVK